ncbi:MAG TPA: Piwi domain-containing protein [Burkholderiales bacterium]|nr:Piwi domain-containing protein [Burkholderiales bacterium]
MFNGYVLPPVKLMFGGGTGIDRFRGLQQFGPYKALPLDRAPRFSFVFPTEYRDDANKLYLALRNGIGYFKGLERTFRLSLQKDQVEPITGFSISGLSHEEAAKQYAAAVISWHAKHSTKPDLCFVIHPKTPDWEESTPYYFCKAQLLQEGILSQGVTHDLIESSTQFDWSVANIALAAFSKLGGVPWIVAQTSQAEHIVVGVGRVHLYDRQTRKTAVSIGFTACFTGTGQFKFTSIGRIARTRDEYFKLLRDTVEGTLSRAIKEGAKPTTLSVHVPKEFSNEERRIVTAAAVNVAKSEAIEINVIRINDEDYLFAVDPATKDGVPPRGTVIEMSAREFMLYTEGREEKQAWSQRTPTALRVVPQDHAVTPLKSKALIAQINDLSQVNWRGFNARSKPISILYGNLIARTLSHISPQSIEKLYGDKALALLQTKMWFL